MEIVLGKTYYYNNREVVPIEKQGDTDFYKCLVNFDQALDLRGDQFCTPCMCWLPDGSHPTHSHNQYQDVIDTVLAEKPDQDIMFLPDSMLKEHYFEYKKNECLLSEIEKNKARLDNSKLEISEKLKSVDCLQSQIYSLDNIVKEAENSEKELSSKILELEKERIQLSEQLSNQKPILIEGTQKTISASYLLQLLKADMRMDALEDGGVDNWEWYGESLGDRDFEQEALKELLSL